MSLKVFVGIISGWIDVILVLKVVLEYIDLVDERGI